jgi:ABC-type uncharacterized transport system involved in gliding motility auxiliary subunit
MTKNIKENIVWFISLLLILSIVGYVSEAWLSGRFDFTRNKQFTLSPATGQLLKTLDDRLSVRAVFSENLPTQFAQLRIHVNDLLREMERSSGGKLRVVREDPGLDSIRRANVIQEGIREIQVTEQTRDGAVAKRGFFGLVLTYGTEKEVVPLVESIENFEYDLMSRIIRLSGKSFRLGIYEGRPADVFAMNLPTGPQMALQSGFRQLFPSLNHELQSLYKVETIQPGMPIDAEVPLILYVAVNKPDSLDLFYIDQYLMQGGNIIFFAPVHQIYLDRGLHAERSERSYLPWLAHMGFHLQDHLLMDVRFASGNFGRSQFGTPYPYFLVADDLEIDREHPITSRLGMMIFPWTSGLKMDTSAGIENFHLISSTNQAWAVGEPFDLTSMIEQPGRIYPGLQSQFTLAGMRTGSFKSFFSAPPKGASKDVDFWEESQAKSSVLVVPNAFMMTDFFIRWSTFLGQSSLENLTFVLNAVDYLALDPRLIDIRSKRLIIKPISDDAYQKRQGWILFNLVVSPFILLVVGLIIVMHRKRKEAKQWP